MLAIAVISILAGCSSADRGTGSSADQTSSYDAAKEALSNRAPMHEVARQIGEQRAVVRQATLDVDVENIDKAEKRMKEIIASNAGYIDHEEGTGLAGDRPVLHLTIRVPEKSFEDVLSGFEGLGHRTQKSISAGDLTEQILDLEAQLKQMKATPRNDGLGLETLKNLVGQRDALAAKAAMSTIELTLHQKPSAALSTAANANWGGDTWNAAMTSALGAFRVIGALAIWALVYSPIWGLAAFGLVLALRLRKRHAPRLS
ncbi:MAG TPA: DUF4349 domain-containing protein [Fimbriimonadaceae bacterium]|nr:DUF4349 domain-containing protein [Fimbriimonadaceae bacterium]